ncbi:MAG: hypothetical protein ACREJ0_04135 [Geminicoccaceae bacterium]
MGGGMTGDDSGQLAPAPTALDRSAAFGSAVVAPDVFVTAGTDHHPFDRLVDMVEAWASARRAAG